MDQLCVVTNDKTMVFYEFQGSSSSYKFEEDKSVSEKGYQLPHTPSQIHWENELIYIATKKAYMILQKSDGVVVQQV